MNSAEPQDGSKVTSYRTLTADDIAQMNELKEISRDFCEKLDIERTHLSLEVVVANSEKASERDSALRCLAIARTKMQEACMWAVRAIARPDNDC
ncbi:Acb2/Tad1 domain-containing protein [Salmonella enterica]